MNNQEKESYIRGLITYMVSGSVSESQAIFPWNSGNLPSKLYKYCRFDNNGHYLDALENDYLYLAPYEAMDDQFEGMLNIPHINPDGKVDNSYIESIISECLQRIMNVCNIEDDTLYDLFMSSLAEADYSIIAAADTIMNQHFSEEEKQKYEEVHRLLAEEQFQKTFNDLAELIATYRVDMGLTSLCEVNNSQIMWQLYGDNYKGFIIEYDISEKNKRYMNMLYPVIYKEKRSLDPIRLVTDMIIGGFVKDAQTPQRVHEFMVFSLLTKNTEWELQKEWRFIGGKTQKISSPPITGIYIGSQISEENLEKINKIRADKKIKMYKQYNDWETTSLRYKTVEEE